MSLDDKSAVMLRQCKALRQEEIIAETEVIWLSAVGLGKKQATRHFVRGWNTT